MQRRMPGSEAKAGGVTQEHLPSFPTRQTHYVCMLIPSTFSCEADLTPENVHKRLKQARGLRSLLSSKMDACFANEPGTRRLRYAPVQIAGLASNHLSCDLDTSIARSKQPETGP